MQQVDDIIQYIFDWWADPVVHLLSLKSSVFLAIQRACKTWMRYLMGPNNLVKKGPSRPLSRLLLVFFKQT